MTLTVGSQIRAYRKARKLTQEQLAEQIGASPVMVGYLERGKRPITVKWLERIASAFEVAARDLLPPEPNEPASATVSYIVSLARADALPLDEQFNVTVPENIGGHDDIYGVLIDRDTKVPIFRKGAVAICLPVERFAGAVSFDHFYHVRHDKTVSFICKMQEATNRELWLVPECMDPATPSIPWGTNVEIIGQVVGAYVPFTNKGSHHS